MTSFVGVLTRRQYKPGQRYIQLVFDTHDGSKVSLSRNVKLVKLMEVGQTYRIEGVERALGDKTFIEEPRAFKVAKELKLSHRRRLKTFGIVGGLAALGLVGYLVLGSQQSTQLQVKPTAHQATVKPVTDKYASTDVTTTATAPATTPTPTPPATTPVVTKLTAQTVTPPAPGVSAPPVTVPVVVTPVVAAQPDCDQAVPVLYTPSPLDGQPGATVVTAGVNGSQQTCYPNGRAANGITTVLLAPVNEVVTVPPPAPVGP